VAFICVVNIDNPNVQHFLVVALYLIAAGLLSMLVIVGADMIGITKVPGLSYIVYFILFVICVYIFGTLGRVVDAIRVKIG